MKPPMHPVVWAPPPVRAELAHKPKHVPALERIPLPERGEDVVVDAQGRLLTGLADGRVVRLTVGEDRRWSRGARMEVLANTGGRPIGLELDAEQRVIVCDAKRGLLRIDPRSSQLEVLVDAATHGLGFCNNAAIARDGTIYFSDSSQRFPIEHWRGELLAHTGTGRLLRRAPDGEVQVLQEGLEFANGVALAPDESFVAVAETTAYRVSRYWLHGPRSGERDLLIDRLPGFPDNLASDEQGRIWIALANPRNALLDFLLPKPALLRQLIWKLPQRVLPRPERTLRVLAVDAQGQVVRDEGGRSRAFHMVTGMRVHDGVLYLASLEERALAALRLA